MAQTVHTSVLLQEVIDGLNLKKGARVLDGTFGGGGHTREILKRDQTAQIIALDADMDAINRGVSVWGEKISFHNINFRNMDTVLKGSKVSGVMLDLGLSSDQLESSGRGFSFMRDEPLLMTLKNISGSNTSMKENSPSVTFTAEDVVNDWGEESLETIIRGFGGEKFSKRIARAICSARKQARIKTTLELAQIIEHAVGRRGKIHPATKTFQAIRIAVNDELGALKEGMERGFDALEGGGRLAIISFHSLEDRLVKNYFKDLASKGLGKVITKKPIVGSVEEVKDNPRARSAKLRIIEKI